METRHAALISIQVGKPRSYRPQGDEEAWESGIRKSPVEGPVFVGATNVDGDGQADTRNHGGPYRAVLGYSADHYPVWREDLAMPDLPYGAFGENFTITGLDEESVALGDVFRIGDQVVLRVSQPRAPCWKLARRWGIKDLMTRVFDRNWGGWYHSVVQGGTVEAGMPVTRIEHPHPKLTIDYVNALRREWVEDGDALRELAALDALNPRWRLFFEEMVGKQESNQG